ncbi:MAG: SMI1/KNR4 family protein [Clostridia bacterium]|nr:SMI1/KNR4 family protein [Clostridia bacterium]
MENIIDLINGLSDLIALKPAIEKQISDAENQLGLKFANDYKEYLAKFGAIMADGIELSGIAKSEHRNVVSLTQQEWGLNKTVPHNMYVVENLGIDGIIIWQDEKGVIYQSTPNTEPIKIANSLAEYISAR